MKIKHHLQANPAPGTELSLRSGPVTDKSVTGAITLSLMMLILSAAVTGVSLGAEFELKTIVCPLVSEAPTLDGSLEDSAWQTVPVQADFTDRHGVEPAQPATEFRIISDGQWLFFGLRLHHPENRDHYDLDNRGRDAVDFRHETVEIFIAPDVDHDNYYHFALEPGGTDYDNVPGGHAVDFNSGWRHATVMEDDYWTAEIAIPLAGIGLNEGVAAGSRLAVNICRTTGGPVNLQAWSPTGSSFHNRDAFGEVVIGSLAAAARAKVNDLAAMIDDPDRAEEVLADLRRQGAAVQDSSQWQDFVTETSRLHRQFLQQSLGAEQMVVWHADPWAMPTANELPRLGYREVEEIRIQAFQGEHLVRAIGIANSGEEMLQVRAVTQRNFRDLDGAISGIPVVNHLQLHQALEVAMDQRPRRDALPRVRFHDSIAVPAGGNAILWLNFDTHNLEPGLWSTQIELLPTVQQQLARHIPVIIEVLPARLHRGPRPYALAYCANPYGGGFLNGQAAGPYDPETSINDLKSYLVNAFFIPAGETGYRSMEYDEQGRMIGTPDFSAMEKWIADFGSENVFFVLSLFYDYLPAELGGGGEWGEIEARNFGRFVGHVRDFFARHGIGVENFAWYAADEPGVAGAHSVANFGKLLQATDPDQQIYVTVYGSTPMEALRIMAPYVNLWVPKFSMTDEQQEFLDQQEVRFFSYMVYPRNVHPYRHVRSMGLKAFEHGYEGVGIWAYGAWDTMSGRSLWHDDARELGIHKYALSYEGDGELISSPRKEAWRLGIQDYRYLEWLSDLAAATPVPELARRAAEKQQLLLDTWHQSTANLDRYIDAMRPLIMELLVSVDTVSDEEWQAHQSLEIPALLTCNGQVFAVRRIATGGYYYYDYDRTAGQYGENCRVDGGDPIYFRGSDAVSGPQSENRIDGNLTDGLFHRPGSFLLFWAPASLTVTFDFQDVYRLNQAFYYGSRCAFTVFVSTTGEEDEWLEVDSFPVEWPAEKFNQDDGAARIDLQDRPARYLRLKFYPEPERPEEPGKRRIQLNEIKVFGFDLEG